MNERIDKWIQTILICMMLAFVAFTTKQCTESLGSSISVIQYDGFKNSCEIQGGVVHDGKCFDSNSLIPVEID